MSYGVHLYTSSTSIENQNNSLSKLNLQFNLRLKLPEENNVYFRLYNGKKWIKYTERPLTINDQYFDITHEFDLNSKSLWRLSSTSSLLDQEIIFEDFVING